MLHVEIINQIVDAEKSARKITEDAKENLARLDTTLNAEYKAMRASFLERAEHRLEIVTETEQSYANEVIAKLDRDLEDAIRTSEESAARSGTQWVDKLFKMVVADPDQ